MCVPPVGSTCCSYAGRHTTCREYCQAIFRTDSTPTVSQINAVKEYCQSHSAQLLSCVSNFTKSYPIRSPLDSESMYTLWETHTDSPVLLSTAFISQTHMHLYYASSWQGLWLYQLWGKYLLTWNSVMQRFCFYLSNFWNVVSVPSFQQVEVNGI